MAHTLDRLDASKPDFSHGGWTEGRVVGTSMEWWPQTAAFEGDALAHLPVAQPDGFEDNAEYLGNVRGTCGHYADDALTCAFCGVTDCCSVRDVGGCGYAPDENLCSDCFRYCGCPECVGV